MYLGVFWDESVMLRRRVENLYDHLKDVACVYLSTSGTMRLI